MEIVKKVRWGGIESEVWGFGQRRVHCGCERVGQGGGGEGWGFLVEIRRWDGEEKVSGGDCADRGGQWERRGNAF